MARATLRIAVAGPIGSVSPCGTTDDSGLGCGAIRGDASYIRSQRGRPPTHASQIRTHLSVQQTR